MKSIDVRATLIHFLGLAVVTAGHAKEYDIYNDLDGKPVVSHRQRPPGSKNNKTAKLARAK